MDEDCLPEDYHTFLPRLPSLLGCKAVEEDMAEVQLQAEEIDVAPLWGSIISRVKSSSISNVFGPLGLGLLAGGCMGAMSAEMASLLKEAAESQTALTMKIPKLYPFISSSYVTYISLLGAMLASAIGVESGRQAYNLVRKQSWDDSTGNALGLAAPVAVFGIAVSGAAVGAVLEKYTSHFVLPYLIVDSGTAIVLWHMLVFTVVSFLLFAFLGFYYGGITVVVSFLTTLLTYSEHVMTMLFFSTGSILFLDLGSLLPLIPPSLLLSLFRSLQLSRTAVMIPTVMITIVLITRNLFRDEHQLVPLLDQAEVTLPALLVLERFFVVVLGIQMFQASCGAVLYSYFVTGEAGKVYTGALAATTGIIMTLPVVSPMLGTGGSLGALLAASGGAGVALSAAGDIGQRYGGHLRAAGAAGAAFGAFLLLATQDVEFGIMVALCAAAIPGSPYLMSCWSTFSVYLQMLIPVLRRTLLMCFITAVSFVALVSICAILYTNFSSILIFFIFISLVVFSDRYL